MVRRTPALVATVFAVVLAGAAAQAQQLSHRPDRPRCNNPRAIARFVQLTPEQVQQTRALYDALRDATEPLREQIAPLREDLETLLDGASPEPAAVGQIVIDIDGLRDEIVELREAAEADFVALLTPEQLTRWERFQQVCRPGQTED